MATLKRQQHGCKDVKQLAISHTAEAYSQQVLVCFALKINIGASASPAALIHSIAVIHSCRPCTTFQLDFSRTFYKYPRRLAGTHCESRFVHVVDSFWRILVLQEELCDSVKPPLDRFSIDSIVPRAFYLACPSTLDIWMTFPEAIKPSLSDRAP